MQQLLGDLKKAGKIISQYQKFYHDLKDKLYIKLDFSRLPPKTIQTINVEKSEWDKYLAIKKLISEFEIELK